MIGVVAALITVGALILSIIGVAIPYWESHDDIYGFKFHTGLWQFCVAGKSVMLTRGIYLAGCINIGKLDKCIQNYLMNYFPA